MEWTALTPVEIQELKAQKYSQAEVCYITGLSPERILTWHKANLIPEPRKEKGRGKRRKYNFHQLAWLSAMRILSARGVPLVDAKMLAEVVLVELLEEGFERICACESIVAADREQVSSVVIYDIGSTEGAKYRFEVFWHGRPISAEDADSLEAWMRAEGLSDVIYIDIGSTALNLRLAMESVLAGRGTQEWRETLREFMQDFKRNKEPKG